MTDCTPIEITLRDALNDATDRANSWRGRCINLFARGEDCIAGALESQLPTGAKQPMLVGKKVEKLRGLVGEDSAVGALLADYASLLSKRTALTHGSGTVWAREKRTWLLILAYGSSREPTKLWFTSDEAEDFRRRLHSVVDRLQNALKV